MQVDEKSSGSSANSASGESDQQQSSVDGATSKPASAPLAKIAAKVLFPYLMNSSVLGMLGCFFISFFVCFVCILILGAFAVGIFSLSLFRSYCILARIRHGRSAWNCGDPWKAKFDTPIPPKKNLFVKIGNKQESLRRIENCLWGPPIAEQTEHKAKNGICN